MSRRSRVLAGALMLLAAACGKPDDALRLTALPGLDVALPGWAEHHRGERWANDRVALGDERSGRMLLLQWSPAGAMWGEAELDVALGAARSAFHSLSLDPVWNPVTVNAHAGLDRGVHLGGTSGRLTSWFCADHQRQYLLMTLGPEAVHQGVVGSVRCHARPAPPDATARAAVFAAFEPLPGMVRAEGDDPAVQSWVSDDVVIVLTAGSHGDMLGTLPDQAMRDAVRSMMRLAALGEPGEVTTTRVQGEDGLERAVFTTVVRSADTTLDVRVAIWRCAAIDRTLMALHMAEAGKIDPLTAERHLLRARCP